jgi:NADH-quinone oxidoreductase subunit L
VLASALAHGTYGALLWVVGICGAYLTGAYTFRMIFMVFGGEPSEFVREHFHALRRDLVGVTMAVPVGILAVLAVVGGWIQVFDWWDLVSDWLNPVALPLVESSGTQEAVTSLLAVSAGVAGLATAWWIYSLHRAPAPATSRVLVHKFYFDEAYDLVFYRPAVALTKGLYAWFEKPVIGGSIAGIALGGRRAGAFARSLQTGAVRAYALVLAAGVVVLAVVFVAVK